MHQCILTIKPLGVRVSIRLGGISEVNHSVEHLHTFVTPHSSFGAGYHPPQEMLSHHEQ